MWSLGPFDSVGPPSGGRSRSPSGLVITVTSMVMIMVCPHFTAGSTRHQSLRRENLLLNSALWPLDVIGQYLVPLPVHISNVPALGANHAVAKAQRGSQEQSDLCLDSVSLASCKHPMGCVADEPDKFVVSQFINRQALHDELASPVLNNVDGSIIKCLFKTNWSMASPNQEACCEWPGGS